jgi:hypothetical protein
VTGKSSDDLSVVVSDLQDAARTFASEGSEYRSGMPYDGTRVPFGCPRAGTELIDRILENTLRLMGEVHVEIGQAMMNHGYRLEKAAEQYSNTEHQTTTTIAQVFLAAETTPLPPDEPNFG